MEINTTTLPRTDTPEMTILIDTSGLSQIAKAQIATLRHKIKLCHAYSLFYHNKARLWSRIGWIIGMVTPLIAAAALIVNAFFTECEVIDRLRAYNTISNALLGALMGIFAFIDVGGRRKENEEGGDEYYSLADGTYTEAFLTMDITTPQHRTETISVDSVAHNASTNILSEIDFGRIIERFTTKFECLNKIYPAPAHEELKKLMSKIEKYPIIWGDISSQRSEPPP